ncbi:multidrug effflux MFS transporter [Reinekea thalattae]|uniref:Bcr/CflA family efflux transporter n=1 Tax=Reinekea thalattae TaxID=2593301 RepID=A0A5C8Z874_9GAMM|nr:multidrug effflux MFS transporter [Reinekea thalattae]TXR53046.1 multidrug effflux MFS transporter [Reinekea thalattae]
MTRHQLSSSRTTAMILVLGLLTIFPPLATDMYLSAIGHVASSLNSSRAAAELSLSLFFLGLCIGQLIMGPLIDAYGRKRPLMLGIAIFCLSSLALIQVENIWLFNALRLIQAIGACTGMVVSRAIVNDLYEGQEAAKVMTLLVMLLTVGPIISPTLGSLLLEAFGWRSIFICMLSVGVVAFILGYFILPETLAKDLRVQRPFVNGAQAAKRLLNQASFLKPTLIAGLIQGGMFSFITGSSGVFQTKFGLSALQYGFTFAGIALALFVFGRINTLLLNKFLPLAILKRALVGQLVIASLLLAASFIDSLVLLVIPLWFAIGFVALISANAMALAMSAAKSSSGIGSALLGAIQFSIAFIVSTSVAVAGSGSATPMALGFVIPCIIALGLAKTVRPSPPVAA